MSSTSKCRELREKAEKAVKSAVLELEMAQKTGRNVLYSSLNDWESVHTSASLEIVRKPDLFLTGSEEFRVFGEFLGDLDEILQFFHTDTSDSYRSLQQLLFHRVKHAQIVETYEKHENDILYFGVKYSLIQPLSGVCMMASCVTEYMGRYISESGITYGFLALFPSEMPHFHRNSKMPTLKCTNIFIFQSNSSESIQKCHLYAFGSFDSVKMKKKSLFYVRNMCDFVENARILMHLKRLKLQKPLDKTQWIPNKQRTCCNVCLRVFNATRFRHHCRLCGEVVCRKCMDMGSFARKLKDNKFCKICVWNLKEKKEVENGGIGTEFKVDIMSDREKEEIGNLERRERKESDSDIDKKQDWEWSGSRDMKEERNENNLHVYLPEVQEQLCITDSKWSVTDSNSGNWSITDMDECITATSSISSNEEVVMIDTKDMLPVKEGMNWLERGRAFQRYSYSLPECESFQTIDKSIQEQQALLHRLVLCANGKNKM